MFWSNHETSALPGAEQALPGRNEPLPLPAPHRVTGRSLLPPYPATSHLATFGLGCFWGAERRFWQVPGVWVTAVGYAGGYTRNPTYDEVCSGLTGHAEVVRVVYDPDAITYAELLCCFWESHDPTQGMRQGNDVGTQYRSLILAHDAASLAIAEASRTAYQTALSVAGCGEITTEIGLMETFYLAEDYHQQYLAQHPAGYCGLGGTRVACPSLTPMGRAKED